MSTDRAAREAARVAENIRLRTADDQSRALQAAREDARAQQTAAQPEK